MRLEGLTLAPLTSQLCVVRKVDQDARVLQTKPEPCEATKGPVQKSSLGHPRELNTSKSLPEDANIKKGQGTNLKREEEMHKLKDTVGLQI